MGIRLWWNANLKQSLLSTSVYWTFQKKKKKTPNLKNNGFCSVFRIVVGLVAALTVVGSVYEMVLERRKAGEFRRRQIGQGNNNEGDAKVEFTLDKMQALEKMHMKGRGNDDGTLVEQDPLFKGKVS